MRIDAHSGGRRTNKTTRYNKYGHVHDSDDLPALDVGDEKVDSADAQEPIRANFGNTAHKSCKQTEKIVQDILKERSRNIHARAEAARANSQTQIQVSTKGYIGRAPIPENKADRYLAWMNTSELPGYGSTRRHKAWQRTTTNIQRGHKKQKKCAIIRHATEDSNLADILPRKSGFQHSRYDGR